MKEVKISFAVNSSVRIIHIGFVKNDSKDTYSCAECQMPVVPVLGNLRRHHFRHLEYPNMHKCRDGALHKYAVQVILENNSINIPGGLALEYIPLGKEFSFLGIRSDATIQYNGEDVHFEIVVTNDLHESKIDKYIDNKIKSIAIYLDTKKFATASEDIIRQEILVNTKNKKRIYWPFVQNDTPENNTPLSRNKIETVKPPVIIEANEDKSTVWIIGGLLVFLTFLGVKSRGSKWKNRCKWPPAAGVS